MKVWLSEEEWYPVLEIAKDGEGVGPIELPTDLFTAYYASLHNFRDIQNKLQAYREDYNANFNKICR
jgi:hypothetical protein